MIFDPMDCVLNSLMPRARRATLALLAPPTALPPINGLSEYSRDANDLFNNSPEKELEIP